MMRLFLLFSHKLTLSQKEYAKNEFGIKDFIYLPTNLQQLFSNIPPEFAGEAKNGLLRWLQFPYLNISFEIKFYYYLQ